MLMWQTICFQALQGFPIEQQLRMLERLQRLNEQCDTIASVEEAALVIDNEPNRPQVVIADDDKSNVL